MYDILCDLFAERMPEDKTYKYKPDTVNVYFENRLAGKLHKIDVRKTIKEITGDKQWVASVFMQQFLKCSKIIKTYFFLASSLVAAY